MNTKYIIIWFEGTDNYTLVDHSGHFKLLTRTEVARTPELYGILMTQEEVDDAQEDVKYAISTELFSEVFGVDVD